MSDNPVLHRLLTDIVNNTMDETEADDISKLLWTSFQMLPKTMTSRFAGVARFVHTFLEDEVRRLDGLDAGNGDDEEKIKSLLGTLDQLVLQQMED